MSNVKSSVDILFREHSFEEIESVRDKLASEIDKRTELFKSIVKEKYRDVVDTSDAIQAMKTNLTQVQNSIQNLDASISFFYQRVKEPQMKQRQDRNILQSSNSESSRANQNHVDTQANTSLHNDGDLKQLLRILTEIWDHFESDNLKTSIKMHDDGMALLEKCRCKAAAAGSSLLNDIESNLNRSKEIIKTNLWFRVQSAEPNQIGVIAESDKEQELYMLSLQASIEHLVGKLRKDISDTSYHAQIRRYQPYSYFNTETNHIDPDVNDMKPPASGHLQIPSKISIELSVFLFDICRAINTIAGFSLTRTSILAGLRLAMTQILDVYEALVRSLGAMSSGGSKTRRALQLYFDLKYVRVLLNTTKDLELIDELDTRISDLMSKFEEMLDRIELYMVSDAMHTNVVNLSKSTVRLYGLLIPH